MADAPISTDQREFRCSHCDGTIRIPRNLPPTTGPCPHCSGIITSPALEISPAAPAQPQVVPSPPEPPSAAPVPMSETPPLPPPTSPRLASAPSVLEIPAVPTGPPSLTSARTDPPSIHAQQRSEVVNEPAPVPVAAPEETTPELPTKVPARKAAKPHRSGLIPLMLVLLALGLILLGVVFYLIRELGKSIAPPTQAPPVGATSSINEADLIGGGHASATAVHQ